MISKPYPTLSIKIIVRLLQVICFASLFTGCFNIGSDIVPYDKAYDKYKGSWVPTDYRINGADSLNFLKTRLLIRNFVFVVSLTQNGSFDYTRFIIKCENDTSRFTYEGEFWVENGKLETTSHIRRDLKLPPVNYININEDIYPFIDNITLKKPSIKWDASFSNNNTELKITTIKENIQYTLVLEKKK